MYRHKLCCGGGVLLIVHSCFFGHVFIILSSLFTGMYSPPPPHWPAQLPRLPVSMGDLIVKCISELFFDGTKRAGMDTHNSLMACVHLTPGITSLQ